MEYKNIAEDNPEIVDQMMEKMMEYWSTMIPADVGKDVEEGNPIHFNGTFSPGFCDSEPYWQSIYWKFIQPIISWNRNSQFFQINGKYSSYKILHSAVLSYSMLYNIMFPYHIFSCITR